MGSSQSRVKPPPPSLSSPRMPTTPNKTLNRRLSRKFSHIADQYSTLEQVQRALSSAGLESSNLIVGIDFTKSNEWTGKLSFSGRCLHALCEEPNPYEQAISIIGQTLAVFDEDNLIPCFGFGDASTHDQFVFSFFQDHRPCAGFEEALSRYRSIAPNLRLAGPTSFAPIIEAAMGIVEESGGQYHVLLIIADGQVTRSVDTESGYLSPQEQSTIDSIVAASDYPLSIVLVGVGDGPWETMREFDDNIPNRAFDNFQFVNFTDIMRRNLPAPQKEAMFALASLMEIPQQYKATMELGILGRQTGIDHCKHPLPPPPAVLQADLSSQGYHNATSFSHSSGPKYPHIEGYSKPVPDYYNAPFGQGYSSNKGASSYGYPASQGDNINDGQNLCPICLYEKKDLAFGCGHQTCRGCGKDLQTCPICRERISTRIRLY